MDADELRVAALRLAVDANPGAAPSELIKFARELLPFMQERDVPVLDGKVTPFSRDLRASADDQMQRIYIAGIRRATGINHRGADAIERIVEGMRRAQIRGAPDSDFDPKPAA